MTTDEPLPDQFARLAAQWRKERGFTSLVSNMVVQPAYQEIIALGRPVVPLILKEFEEGRHDHWFEALRTILDDGPDIPERLRGRIDRMAEIWVEWGKRNGWLKPFKETDWPGPAPAL